MSPYCGIINTSSVNQKKYDIPTERSTLKLLTPVQAVTELEQADIVFGYLVNEMSRCAELTEGKFVVVLVVKDIEEGGEEWVEVLRERVRVVLSDILVEQNQELSRSVYKVWVALVQSSTIT